eukprot:TRINITY_DN9855_c0_g1_i1.p1 TRINITY_DN9855_c0_g1~~TRINITY_DN9855_c0_g1_i1.p1  ORF type:complete len:172 (+),score=28.34 TRINITY_DN9855_c0_g1_i1:54-569(+)
MEVSLEELAKSLKQLSHGSDLKAREDRNEGNVYGSPSEQDRDNRDGERTEPSFVLYQNGDDPVSKVAEIPGSRQLMKKTRIPEYATRQSRKHISIVVRVSNIHPSFCVKQENGHLCLDFWARETERDAHYQLQLKLEKGIESIRSDLSDCNLVIVLTKQEEQLWDLNRWCI